MHTCMSLIASILRSVTQTSHRVLTLLNHSSRARDNVILLFLMSSLKIPLLSVYSTNRDLFFKSFNKNT